MSVLPNLLVTGSVGCGKTSLCAQLAEASGWRHVDVGALVRDRALHDGWDEQHQAFRLDDDKLCDALEAELATGGCIVDFHSTSTFPVRWFCRVLVLRCSTHILHERLTRRGYGAAKVDENVECEIMQVCLDEAREAWDEQQVVEAQSDTHEQMLANVSTCRQWIEQWRAEKHSEPPI